MNTATLRARARHWWVKEIRPLMVLALVLFAIRSSLADWNDVPTGSMKPTILEGDRVYVNKLAYDLKVPFTTWHIVEWSNPRRGDIVVFYSPYDGKRLVKRVIGLPGDKVELRNEVLILNGQPIVYGPIADNVLRDVSAAEGHYFMMGDNRDDSFDSRYWGAVDRKQIVGRATAVVMSTDRKHYWLPRWQRFFSSLKG